MLSKDSTSVLVSKFASGIFDHPYTDETRVQSLDKPEHRVMARQMAEESFVLLINEEHDVLRLLVAILVSVAFHHRRAIVVSVRLHRVPHLQRRRQLLVGFARRLDRGV